MARAKNRLVAFALLAVLAIASLSVGNALWSETLTISGSAATGTLNVTFTNVGANEDADPLGVGGCTATPATGDSFTLTITNAYPGYKCTINFTVSNVGNIPVAAPTMLPSFGTSPLAAYFTLAPSSLSGLAAGGVQSPSIVFEVPTSLVDGENEGLSVNGSVTLKYTQGLPTP